MSQNGNNHIESRLWSAADEQLAKYKMKSSEYSVPVLCLIFLRYADYKFSNQRTNRQTNRPPLIGPANHAQASCTEVARFSTLLGLPEGADIRRAINDAMKAIGPKTRSEGRSAEKLQPSGQPYLTGCSS